ncbi:hypothetical protein LIER_24682 [Lithospermum erythrorhizon]|uniref:Uncharacterized protein n=1 Tax=Lithospermum erythrorhizon TaxID=34254 RepID=A0AAV3R5R9_LITER
MAYNTKQADPWFWHRIIRMRDVLKQVVDIRVVFGEGVSLWYDNWLTGGPIVERLNEEEATWVGVNSTHRVAEISQIR